MERDNVSVSKEVLNKVRKHVEKTGQKIGSFFDLAAEEKLERETKILVTMDEMKAALEKNHL